MYHEHTSYHHLGPLRKALREFSLEIVEAEILETHGGSIRLRIKKNVRKSCISRSVEEIMEHETKSINLNSQSWLDLSSKVTKLRSMILDQSLKTQKDGKYNIYGYGVSAKLVSLYFGLSLDLLGIEQFFDDNQMKVNRYVPGTLNVVKSSTELPVTDKTILLFAWNYMAEIVEALKSKGHQATILCPLPYFKTINI
jgi:hypothetical protein